MKAEMILLIIAVILATLSLGVAVFTASCLAELNAIHRGILEPRQPTWAAQPQPPGSVNGSPAVTLKTTPAEPKRVKDDVGARFRAEQQYRINNGLQPLIYDERQGGPVNDEFTRREGPPIPYE